MVGVMSGSIAPQQGSVLQGGTCRSGFRQRWRTIGLADRRVRRGVQVSIVVVWRVGGGSRRRQITSGSRKTGFRAKSP